MASFYAIINGFYYKNMGSDPTKTGILEGGAERDDLHPDVATVRSETSKRVEKAFKKAGNSKEPVKIADVQITDPAQAYANLQKALSVVQGHFKLDKNDLYFQQLEGETVGEAMGDGSIKIDPIMLMHPVNRLAHVIMHELAHKGGDIENDAVVEAYTRQLLKASGMAVEGEQGLQVTQKYNTALENFHEFARRVSDGKEISKTVQDIYALYYSGNYESIYELYNDRYMNGLKIDKEKDQAFDFFAEVFPELEVHNDGWYKPCEVTSEIDETEKEK